MKEENDKKMGFHENAEHKQAELNASTANPVFANAVEDIIADIAELEIRQETNRNAAEADERVAEDHLAAAQNLEKNAGNLEQPVDTRKEKGQIFSIVGISLIVILGLISGFGIRVWNNPAVKSTSIVEAPTPSSTLPAPIPSDGALMAWVDGSTLVMCSSTQNWMDRAEVSNYQFSLCVAAGACASPADDQFGADLSNPTLANSPAQMVSPAASKEYCAWAQGRLPTNEELSKIGACSGISYAETTKGFRCIVDNPRPMALYCQSSPYFDPTQQIEDRNHSSTVELKGTFCQNGKSYVTFDIGKGSEDTLQSAVPQAAGVDCQVLNDNRVVCGGASGTSSSVTAGLVRNSMAGILDSSVVGILDNSFANPIAGIMDSSWNLNPNGAPVPTNGTHFPGDIEMSAPFTPDFVFVNGVMVAQSLTGNALSSNDLSSNNLSTNGMSVNGLQSNGILYPVCLPGYYFDNKTQTCISLTPPTDATCLSGYNLDKTNMCCAASVPDVGYPGCPTGQILDPLTGACDTHTTIFSPTSLHHTQPFAVTFPDCSTKRKSGDSGSVCPAGTSYVCSGIKVITCGCK